MKKETSYIGLIIFIIIFAIVAIVVTVFLANKQNDKLAQEQLQNGLSNAIEQPKKDEPIIVEIDGKPNKNNLLNNADLVVKHYGTDTFFYNNLTINEHIYYDGEKSIKSYGGEPNTYKMHNQLEAHYITIDGLKDKNIQDKINQEIYSKAVNMSKEIMSEYGSAYLECSVEANFSNILSIFMEGYKWKKSSTEEYMNTEYLGYKTFVTLNYDLTTGKEISLSDYFKKDCNIKNIMSNSVYSAVQSLYMIGGGPTPEGLVKYDKLEDYAFLAMRDFEKEKYKFYIKPARISVIFDKHWMKPEDNGEYSDYFNYTDGMFVHFNIGDIYENVVIYNSFLTKESIFEKGNLASDNIISHNSYYDINMKFKKIANNFEVYYSSGLEKFEKRNDYYNIEESTGRIVSNEELISRKINSTKNYLEKSNSQNMNLYFILLKEYEMGTGYMIEQFIIDKDKYSDEVREKIFSFVVNNNWEEETEFLKNNSWVQLKRNSSYPNSNEYEPHIEIVNSTTGHKYVIPYSEVEESYDREDLELLYSIEKLTLEYNKFFARYGHDFKSKELKDYFDDQIWYLPEYNKTVSLEELTENERKNAMMLKSIIENKQAE